MYNSVWKSEDGTLESFVDDVTGKGFTLKYVKPFKQWIETSVGWDKCLKLKPEDKEKMLLRYKHCTESDYMNLGLEITQRNIMNKLVSDAEKMDGYYNSVTRFEGYCYGVKQEIGLEKGPPEVQRIREIFGDK